MAKILSRTTDFGITIRVHYLEKPEITCDIDHVEARYREVYNTWAPWLGQDWFRGYVVDIYDNEDPDIPRNIVSCTDGVCKTVRPGVGDFSALTYGIVRAEINDDTFGDPDKKAFFDRIIAHETGHSIMAVVGFGRPDCPLTPEWMRRRGIHSAKYPERDGEIPPEDILFFCGCGTAKGYVRGHIVHASECYGLHDMYFIWKKASDFIKKGMPGMTEDVAARKFLYSRDREYFGIQLKYTWRVSFLWWTREVALHVKLEKKGVSYWDRFKWALQESWGV